MARSENWRINKSSLMAVEGAQLLKALQKVAGAAGLPKTYTVKLAQRGQMNGVDFDKREVVIGAGRIFNEAPLPADKMDVLVGLVLHEVGHYTMETSLVWNMASRHVPFAPEFQKFVNIGEDIVVESATRANPNLADYDKALHNWAITQIREAQPHKLLELWIEYALGHKVNYAKIDSLPEAMKEAMGKLVGLTAQLRKIPMSHNCHYRAVMYAETWGAVKDVVLNPPEPPQQPEEPQQSGGGIADQKDDTDNADEPDQDQDQDQDQREPDKGDSDASNSEAEQAEPEQNQSAEFSTTDAEPDGTDQSGSDGGSGGAENVEMDLPLAPRGEDGMDEELARAIEDAIKTEQEDITEEVQDEFGGQSTVGYQIVRSREVRTPLIKPDVQLRKRLERILTIRKRLQARTMHGEQYGRIDKRHLHRVGTDQRIFSLRYKFPDGFPSCRILIDLSSSMSGREACEVLEAAGALQSLVGAEVWCYYRDVVVKLIRVDDGRLVHQLAPEGDTPSGLAIVGVSLGMRSGGLVIHLTDGMHNAGQSPWLAHWILQKRGIDLINLIWGGSVKLYTLAGMNYRQLDGLADFPDALYQILVEQMKLGKIGGKK